MPAVPAGPPAARILAGLVAGLALGAVVAAADAPWLRAVAAAIEPLGALFINAIRMTVVPLVVAKLVVAVAGTDERAVRRLGAGALALFVGALAVATAFSAAVAGPLLDRVAIDPAAVAALREAAGAIEAARGATPTLREWLVGLVPVNAIQAAADGAMLPLIVFAVVFGLGLVRVEPERRGTVVSFFQAVGDAMLVLVRWILVVAPIGVFALAVPLAARLGLAAAGAILYYVFLVAMVCVVFSALVLYPAAVLGGGLTLAQFARAAAPAQAIAFGSRSSLASLPAMMQAARTQLRLPDDLVSFFFPLAASMFRLGTGMAMVVAALFVARLYGVTLDAGQTAAVVLTAAVTTFGSPGIPSGSILVIVPALMAGGIPIEGIGVLLAVDTLPDMLRTTTNITADLAGGAVLARWSRR